MTRIDKKTRALLARMTKEQGVLPMFEDDGESYVHKRFGGMFKAGTIRAQIRDYILGQIENAKASGWKCCVQALPRPQGGVEYHGIKAEDIAEVVYGASAEWEEKGSFYCAQKVRTAICAMQERGFPVGTTHDLHGYFVPMSKEEVALIIAAYNAPPKTRRSRKERMAEVFERLVEAAKARAEVQDLFATDVVADLERRMAAED